MRLLKLHIALIFIICTSTSAFTQSDLLFSNYGINAVAFNPAAIENNNSLNAYFGLKQQWIGWEDAPNMQWLNASTFFDKSNMGVSLNINNQSIGAEITQNVKLGYSYRIYFANGHQLSLGLAAGVYFRKLDFSKLVFEEEEENIPLADESQISADFDFGFEYSFKNLIVGISSNHITTSNAKATILKIPIQSHIYLRYLVDVGDDIILIPGLAYHRGGSIDLFDISADMQYKDIFSVGLKYRTATSFIIRAGIRLNNTFEIKYAYDLGAGKFRNYNSGSHEIILIGRFARKSKNLNSPRFID